jgi:hypothetical protein
MAAVKPVFDRVVCGWIGGRAHLGMDPGARLR